VVRGAETVRLAQLQPAPFADRLVRKFDLPVTGWRGSAARRNNGAA
jgi:NAD+ kinase